MEDTKYNGRIVNLAQLLKEYTIEIPIIQRDYAQGRKDQKEIRENFLDALKKCIANNSPIKLDFIYGSITKGRLQPLDGQQRLTTLFLMHWYAASKEGILGNDKVRSLLINFSYETRISSREFCYDLIDKSISIDSSNMISDTLVNSNWFFLSWKNDPTIDAMLRSIDAIHERFYEFNNLWDKLTSSLIQFYFVELENMGLTDDLYIKMNSRGKLLTAFENFKAGFEKKIEDETWEKGIKLRDTFGVKIDNDWADFFWDDFRKNNSIDNALIRFIATVGMIMQAVERVNTSETRIKLISKIQTDPNLIRPFHFSEIAFKYLVEYFNTYNDQIILHDYSKKNLPFPMWRHQPKSSIFSMIVYDENLSSAKQKNSATYTQKALFFAQAEYLKNNENNDTGKYYDWMRVIRNIVSRADIDKNGSRPDIVRSPESFDGVINLINELSNGCHNIYQYLANTTSLKSQFAKEQIYEEIEKAKLIIARPSLKEIIFKAEDFELFRGKISFLFYAIGYNFNVDEFNADLFSQVSNVINEYFKNESLDNNIRRAMLTIDVNGKYEFYTYWWSYWHVGNATKRRLFDKYREIEYFINNEFYREYFKKLVLKLITKTPETIIEEFQAGENFPNWKLRLIKESKILDTMSNTNYIAIAEENTHCYLLKSKRPRELDGNIKIE